MDNYLAEAANVTDVPARTLLLAIGQVMGTLYIAVAVLLGAGFLYYVGRLLKNTNKASAKKVFVYSNLYLALLFLGMVLDHALR